VADSTTPGLFNSGNRHVAAFLKFLLHPFLHSREWCPEGLSLETRNLPDSPPWPTLRNPPYRVYSVPAPPGGCRGRAGLISYPLGSKLTSSPSVCRLVV
jgi:hypothetical protein